MKYYGEYVTCCLLYNEKDEVYGYISSEYAILNNSVYILHDDNQTVWKIKKVLESVKTNSRSNKKYKIQKTSLVINDNDPCLVFGNQTKMDGYIKKCQTFNK